MNFTRIGIFAVTSIVSFGVNAAAYDVAAYVWPAYHPAARWSELGIFKDGKGEWQNLYEAVKHYPDDYQGVKPLWGYENEADPIAVARKIDAATAAGVNVFIYDWYWYDGRPFLEEALNEGFLKAPNSERMRFYLMYANHDVTRLWDNKAGGTRKKEVLWRAQLSDADWETVVKCWITKYFTRPNYYKINGCPVLSIYSTVSFVKWEGLEKAKQRIAYLRSETRKAGFPDVHFQAIATHLPPDDLGMDSMTFYNWTYRTDKIMWENKEEGRYAEWGEQSVANYDVAKREADAVGAAFFPNVTCGWDTNARYPAGENFRMIHGANPQDFERFARCAKAWTDTNVARGLPKLITVNAWNEWTEGAYLEPDDRFGYGYLNALWRVFVRDNVDNKSGECK